MVSSFVRMQFYNVSLPKLISWSFILAVMTAKIMLERDYSDRTYAIIAWFC